MNNKGFLLVETLITTCIIAILATSMYIYVSNTISNYEKRENYDNIVDIYKVNNIKNYLYNNWTTYGLTSPLENALIKIELPFELKEEFNVSEMFVVYNYEVDEDYKKYIISKTDDKAFKEYIRLLSFVGEKTDYRLIVHFKDNKANTFASLTMKVPGA